MEWAFDAVDALSAPMKMMSSEVDKFDKKLKSADDHLKKFDKDQQHGSHSNKESKESLHGVAAALETIKDIEIAEVLEHAAEKVWELGEEFVETAIHASDFKRASLLSLEATLGTKEAAEEAFETLKTMSRGTSQTTDEMVESFKSLAAQGFGAKAATDILAAAADVLAVQGKTAQQALVDTISNTQALGHLSSRALMSLKQVGAATPEKLMAALAAQHHTTEEAVKKMIEAGTISSAEGINTIMDLVQKNVDKGQALGTMSIKVASGDVKTQVKNLKQSFEDLFEDVNVEPLVNGLKKITELFSPTTETGKKMGEGVQEAFQMVGDAITYGVAHFDDLKTAFGVVADIAKAAWFVLESPFVVAYQLGEAIGAVVFAVMDTWKNVEARFTAAYDYLKSLDFGMIALQMINGLIGGLERGVGGVVDAAKNLGHSMLNSVKDVLGIHSPSKAMFDLGGFTAKGFNEGVGYHSPSSMTDIMPALKIPDYHTSNDMAPRVAAPGPGSLSSVASSGGGSRHVSVGDINVHVDASESGNKNDPHAMATEIVNQVRAEVVRTLEGLSFED